MLKKAIWSIVLIAIVGVLTYGAVNRTLAKTADNDPESLSASHNVAAANNTGSGWGRGQIERTETGAEPVANTEGYGRGYQRSKTEATTEDWQGQGAKDRF